MLSNYLLIAWRNLLKNKIFSLINVFGLAVSLAVCALILLYVHSEFSYDSYHRNSDRIVRITSVFGTPEGSQKMAISGEGVGPLLKEELPEVEAFVRFSPNTGPKKVKVGDQQIAKQENVLSVDPHVFDVFSYRLTEGDAATALADAHNVVLTQSTAEKYFGTQSPMGKEIVIEGERYLVSGVMEDLPENVDTKINALLPSSIDEHKSLMKFAHVTYALLKPGTNLAEFAAKLHDFGRRHYQPVTGEQFSVNLELQPLAGLHFASGYFMDTPKGNPVFSWIFALSGALLFCMALFNFINLSAIRMLERGREVGIRKTIGARKSQLIWQFIAESLLLVAITMVLAFTFLQLALVPFNSLLGKAFSLTDSGTLWLVVTGLGTLGTVVALACYLPAVKLTSMPTAAVLKGKLLVSRQRFGLRKILTVLQFVISGLMVTGVTVIYLQLNFIQNKELGFHASNVLVLDLPSGDAPSKAFDLKSEMLAVSGVTHASLAGYGAVPGAEAPQGHLNVTEGGRNDEYWVNFISVDEDFFQLMDIKMKDGRSFADLTAAEKESMLLVNESFAKAAGLTNPVGAAVTSPILPGGEGKLAGVIANYHFASIHNLIEPLAIDYMDAPAQSGEMSEGGGASAATLFLRLDPTRVHEVEKLYSSFYPNDPIEYRFLDQTVADLYQAENTVMRLFSYLTAIALMVASLGLFALSGYLMKVRTKEIGIRKVLGASMRSLLVLLISEFVLLVLVAQVVALPLAAWAAERWLDGYAYRIELQWWLFAASALTVLVVAVVTVAVKSMRAAHANPVEALRTE